MATKKITIEVDEEANDGLGELKVCSSDMEAEDLMRVVRSPPPLRWGMNGGYGKFV